MSTSTLPLLLTADEVGEWLSLPARRVERMARRGEIPSRLLPSGDRVFAVDELTAWLDKLPQRKEVAVAS